MLHHRNLTVLALAALALAVTGTACAAGLTVAFRDTSSHVSLDPSGPNLKSHLLAAGSVLTDADAAVAAPVTFATAGGVQHQTGWRSFTAAQMGIPKSAKAVILGVKIVITKGDQDADAVVYVHARAHGSAAIAGGDPAHPQYAIDGNYGNPVQEMIGQGAAFLAHDSVRQVSAAIVPVSGGAMDLSWGFRRIDGDFPVSDGVGMAIYVNGYLS